MEEKLPDGWDSFSREDLESSMKAYIVRTQKVNSERATAIISAVQLDEMLGKTILEFMVDCKKSVEVVENFPAAQLGYGAAFDFENMACCVLTKPIPSISKFQL